jgi:hypothetical protein
MRMQIINPVRFSPHGQNAAEMWEEYHTKAYPQLLPGTDQFEQLQQAFYSGIYSTMAIMVAFSDFSEEEAAVKMERLKHEVEAWHRARISKLMGESDR